MSKATEAFFSTAISILEREVGEENVDHDKIHRRGISNDWRELSVDFDQGMGVSGRLTIRFARNEQTDKAETLHNGMKLRSFKWGLDEGKWCGEPIQIGWSSARRTLEEAQVCVTIYQKLVTAATLVKAFVDNKGRYLTEYQIERAPAEEPTELDRLAAGMVSYDSKSDLVEICETLGCAKSGIIDTLKRRIKETDAENGGSAERYRARMERAANPWTDLDADLFLYLRRQRDGGLQASMMDAEEIVEADKLVEAGLACKGEHEDGGTAYWYDASESKASA